MTPSHKLVPVMPDVMSNPVNDACWAFIETMPHRLPGPIFNDVKPAMHAAIVAFINSAPSTGAESMTIAARDVLAERRRQIDVEGWTSEHDDAHASGGMAYAAACYALAGTGPTVNEIDLMRLWRWTRWSEEWFKPKGGRRNLVRAAALILAEIERLDRASAHTATTRG